MGKKYPVIILYFETQRERPKEVRDSSPEIYLQGKLGVQDS